MVFDMISAGLGAIGSLGGLFGGKGGGGQSGSTFQNTTTTTGPVPGSPYDKFAQSELNQINALANQPYPFANINPNDYIANFSEDQRQAMSNIRGGYNSWQPFFNNASGALDATGGAAYDPTQAGAAAFGQASGSPTGLGTASPYLQFSSQSAPDIIQGYMNPYINNVVNASNQLQSQNFLQNVLPGLNDQFVRSGGGLGSRQYGKNFDWALSNFNNMLGQNTQGLLSTGWNSAMNAAQTDLARQGQLGATAGNLALGDTAARTNLGTAMGQNAALGANTGINRAGAYSNLGTNYMNNFLAGNNALMASGDAQRQLQQQYLSAQLGQAREAAQWPYQTHGWAANVANQYQWPMQSNTQGFGGSASGSSGSLIGNLAGGAAALGSIAPMIGSWFGGGNSVNPISAQDAMTAYGNMPQSYTFPGSVGAKRGGMIGHYAEGGYLGINRSSDAKKAQPAFIACEPMEHGFFNLNHSSEPCKAQPAFADTYATGGAVTPRTKADIIRAVHEHELKMHEAKRSELTPIKLMSGGYLGINRNSMPPKAQPAFANTYAGGGRVPRWLSDNVVNFIDHMNYNPKSRLHSRSEQSIEDAHRNFDVFTSPQYFQIDQLPDNVYPLMPPVDTPQRPYGQDEIEELLRNRRPFSTGRPDDEPQFARGGKCGYYNTGGAVPVIKVMRDNTERSLSAHDEREELMRSLMPHAQLDLGPRSGFFQR